MLVERLHLGPRPPIGSPPPEVFPLLMDQKEFEVVVLLGELATPITPPEFLDFWLLWYVPGRDLPVCIDPFGQPARMQALLAMIGEQKQWPNRQDTLNTFLDHAEDMGLLAGIPYLLGALSHMRSTTDAPIVLCWNRPALSSSLVLASFSYHPCVPAP